MILERALNFDCDGARLVGVLSLPPAEAAPIGVLILVGGDQYRAGSHRQFALLARSFAAAGRPSLRFDVRGMGDSEGQARPFDSCARDIACAIDELMQAHAGLRGVVLWGLCDGASAALLYAATDARVKGLVLANPWARTEAGQAQAYLKHYYGARLRSGEFWRKLASGRVRPWPALKSLATQWTRARVSAPAADLNTDLPSRMLQAARRFDGPVLTILSGRDLTAREFDDLASPGSDWAAWRATGRHSRLDLPEANHTFSTQAERQQVTQTCLRWMQEHLP